MSISIIILQDSDDFILSCPVCREKHNLPKKGAEDLPTPFYINNLLELKQEFKTKKEKQEKCLDHGENIKLFCETSRELICLECALTTHRNLPHKHIQEVYQEYKHEIEAHVQTLREKIALFENAVEHILNTETEVTRNGIEVTRKINQHCQEVIDELIEKKTMLLQQTDDVITRKLQSLSEQKEKAKEAMRQLKGCEELVTSSLKEWSEFKIVRDKFSIVKGIKAIKSTTKEPEIFKPIEKANIKFSPSDTLTFGELDYSLHQSQMLILGEAYVKEKSTIELILKSDDQQPFYVFPSLVKGTISPPHQKHTIECDVFETKPGTYQLIFTPQERGAYLLNLTVGGVEIKGCPFTIMVKTKTDSIGQQKEMTFGLKCPWGIGILDDDRIVVAENGDNSLTILAKDGRLSERLVINELNFPRGVAVSLEQDLYVTDNHRITKITLEGDVLATFGYRKPGNSHSYLNYPAGIAVQPSTGDVFVADSKNDRVLVLDPKLTLRHTFPGRQCLNEPSDVAFDSDGLVYVAEFTNHCITKFSRDGVALARIVSKGKRPGFIMKPVAIAIHNQELYVCENGKNRISVFNLNGHFLHFFEEKDSGLLSIAISKQGYLYTSDYHNGRVIIY